MKLLFLTNFYPPASRGGYEQWCQEVAEGLRNRGHDILVLTSRYGQDQDEKAEPGGIQRKLHLEMDLTPLLHSLRFFVGRVTRERANLAYLRQLIEDFAPDIVFIWGMWNLPRSLAESAEDMRPGRVVYYVADYWPTLPSQHEFYWQSPGRHWATQFPKRLLGTVARRILTR